MVASVEVVERRSLAPTRWANLVMGFAGVFAAVMCNASALMLDGLFSAVNFGAAVIAARVASSVQRKPNALRPFGYEIDEPVYIMFRALVLTGIILMAFAGAVAKIYTYASGGEIAPVKLGWVTLYMLSMLIICLALAAWHHRNWLVTKKQSGLLKMERNAAIIDGALSASAGAAFLLIGLLKTTPLSFLVPISDSLVVLALGAYLIWQPIGIFARALREVVGESADQKTRTTFQNAVGEAIAARPFQVLDTAITRVGRAIFAVAYLKPTRPVSGKELDQIRDRIGETCQPAFAPAPIRIELIFSERAPFAGEPETAG